MGGPEMALLLRWGATIWPPNPPSARSAPGNPGRSSISRSAADDVGDGAGEDERVEWLRDVALVAGVGDPS